MNIQQLRYVLHVYQNGSINKAARLLFISQPALSMAIRDLEEELGFDIFERSKKGVVPTPAGSEFIYTIRDVLQGIDGIKAKYIRDGNEHTNLILRVATSRYSFFSDALTQFVRTINQNGDDYSISVQENDCQYVIDSLLNRKVDLGVIQVNSRTASGQLAYFKENSIRAEFLFHSGPYAAFCKGHELEKYDTVTKELLSNYPQIRTSSNDMDYYNWNTNFSFRDYPSCGKNYFISSRGLIYDMLADSDAVFLMTNKIGVSKRHPNLCIRPIDNNVTFTFYALTMIDRRPNPILEDFIGTLKEVCHQKT